MTRNPRHSIHEMNYYVGITDRVTCPSSNSKRWLPTDFSYRINSLLYPYCTAYQFGKLTRWPWRTKGNPPKLTTATHPGQVIAVDQMESSTVGFIAQLKGNLTTKRYQYATIFVDHYSKFGFVYLEKMLSSEETVQAKKAVEAYASNHNVTILLYLLFRVLL